MSLSTDKTAILIPGEPAWDVARLFPDQGDWSETEYLDLGGNRPVEFSDGFIEVLSMPTMSHQEIVLHLYDRLKAFASPNRLGKVLVAAFPVRLRPGKLREPDVLFMLAEHADRMGEQFWEGADLVMEVVSEDRARDLEVKRSEYAIAGIPEYWIVDPKFGRITVLTLEGASYAVHGEYGKGERAASRLLPGFEVDVSEAMSPVP